MDIKDVIAPCGLNCIKCINNENGRIKMASIELLNLLGNFGKYAERFSEHNEVFRNYPQFEEFLLFLTKADCKGCRVSGCKFPSCNVVDCVKNKNIDFCFECEKFPCEDSGFEENLQKRWIATNKKIKEIGVERYVDETKDAPRYL